MATINKSNSLYRSQEGQAVFTIPGQQTTKKVDPGSIIMNIDAEKRDLQKIYLHRRKGGTQLTGNAILDTLTKINDWVVSMNKITTRDLATVYRLLAVMINAGIPMIKSLNTMGIQSEKNPRLAKIMFSLAHEVETGSSLSKAMSNFPDTFTEAMMGAVQAGEASGQLNKTLADLASELEKSASIAGKVKGAMIYPIAILALIFGVVFLMMVMVVPQISQLFTSSGKALPLPTVILIAMSNFTVAYWYLILGGVAAGIFGLLSWKKTKSGKAAWDTFVVSLPVFGDLLKKSILAKFAHSFGNLMASGVPIIKAIEIVAAASGNEVYRKRLLLAAEDMKGGIPMAESLLNSKLFPSMLVNMIEIGEQTAQLENVTRKVADFYDEEVDEAVKSLTKLMEPLIMVVMGVVVGGLVAAIMLPIIQLTDIGSSL